MLKSIYLAGVGSQGLQVIGKTIAAAANKKNYHVTYSPKYGTAKRGGLSSCYVVISDGPIGNPRRKKHDLVLTLEPKTYQQFRNDVKPGGLLIVNSTLVTDRLEPAEGVKEIPVPLHSICMEIGNNKVISAVALGTMSELLKDILGDEKELLYSLLETLPEKPGLREVNERAYNDGKSAMKVCISDICTS